MNVDIMNKRAAILSNLKISRNQMYKLSLIINDSNLKKEEKHFLSNLMEIRFNELTKYIECIASELKVISESINK